VDGAQLAYAGRVEPLSEDPLRGLLDELLNDRQKQILTDQWQLCFSRTWPGIGRFRASVYFHGACPEMAIRVAESSIRTREDRRLPTVVDELTRKPNGLVLITAPPARARRRR
jgi:twitching motility protein PilT